jgi:hypothetical protein
MRLQADGRDTRSDDVAIGAGTSPRTDAESGEIIDQGLRICATRPAPAIAIAL